MLRRTKSVRNASEAELEAIEEGAERWAGISVWVVVVALAVEVFASFLPPPVAPLAEFACNALVALGVAFELMFSRAGSKAQGELTRRAKNEVTEARREAANATGLAAQASWDAERANDAATEATDRLAVAEGLAAQANERAAELAKEAAEARRRTAELEFLTSPRRLSPEDRQGIIEWASPFAADTKLLVQSQSLDAEAYGYARAIATAFLRAGVRREFIELTTNSWLSGLVFGVHMQSDIVDVDKLQELDKFIESPFIVTKRDLSMSVTLAHFRPTLYIFVGPRVTGTFDDSADDVEPTVWA